MLLFTMYQKAAKEIKEINLQWSERMNELKKKEFDVKDALNLKKGTTKTKDLEYLKRKETPRPSTLHYKFIESNTVNGIDKQNRLYIEVRYAKATSLSVNNKTLNNFFKLRHQGKSLNTNHMHNVAKVPGHKSINQISHYSRLTKYTRTDSKLFI